MYKYEIVIFRWFYSGLKDGNPRELVIDFESADYDIESAYKYAQLILKGIKLDERVWKCGISEIRKVNLT
jgi:hypothetical protein